MFGIASLFSLESAMFFAIGFLLAAVIGLAAAPAVHGRAVRLTTRRLDEATPLSMKDMQADKDQLRAQFAMATRQLETWADRLGLPYVKGADGGDPAAVAFDAVDAAQARGRDTVIVDTAGRLHTQDDLMKQLQKVARVVARRVGGAPHETLLALDGATGQNAVQQGRVFTAALPLTGLVVTKLDGTARGGSVVALRRELELPVRFLGVGEGADDLEVFDARAYAKRLLAD